MKKSTIETMISYLNGADVDTAELRNILQAELDKMTEKARENANAYDNVRDLVLSVMSTTPMTVAEIYDKISTDLPEGFSRNKVSYGLLHQWADKVEKHENGKNPNTYSLIVEGA